MLSIVGLGLRDGDVSLRGLEALEGAEEAYVELYTNSLDLDIETLEERTGTYIEELEREDVEERDAVVERSGEKDVVFLVSGDPLFATTHQDILFRARERGIETEVIHAPSILNALGRTGLSPYKFGRVTTIPEPREGKFPESPLRVIENNREMGLHSLVLLDPEMEIETALETIKEEWQPLLVLSRLGTEEEKIAHGMPNSLEDLKLPASLVIPGEINDNERERLGSLEGKDG